MATPITKPPRRIGTSTLVSAVGGSHRQHGGRFALSPRGHLVHTDAAGRRRYVAHANGMVLHHGYTPTDSPLLAPAAIGGRYERSRSGHLVHVGDDGRRRYVAHADGTVLNPRLMPDAATGPAESGDGPPPDDVPAGLTFKDGSPQPRIDGAARRIFGGRLTGEQIATLAGSDDGAAVTITVDGAKIVVRWRSPRAEAVREIASVAGRPVIRNVSLDRFDDDGELPLRCFIRQVRQAAYRGVRRIETLASRSQDHDGYRTWPLLGFDGRIPANSPVFPGRRLSDVLQTSAGRFAWQESGVSVAVAFDPSSKSRSRRVLDAFIDTRAKLSSLDASTVAISTRGATSGGPVPADEAGGELAGDMPPVLTANDEAALFAVWSRVAREQAAG